MELYHITKEKYLTSILTDGLKINSGKTGFCKRDAHQRYKSHYGMQPIGIISFTTIQRKDSFILLSGKMVGTMTSLSDIIYRYKCVFFSFDVSN